MYRFFRLFIGLLCAAGLLAAGSAQALTLNIDSAGANAGNTPDQTFNSCTAGGWSCDEDNGEFASAVAIIDAGGAVADEEFAMVGAEVAYQSILTTDTSWYASDHHHVASDYNITLNMNADPGTIYEVHVWTWFGGELDLYDDTWGTYDAEADITGVTGVASIVGDEGSLSFADETPDLSGDASQSATISGSSETWHLSGLSGNTVLSMNFNWLQHTWSDNNAACIRLGLEGTVPGIGCDFSADPSFGHRVLIQASVVSVIPEPGTFALLSIGLLGLAVYSRRTS